MKNFLILPLIVVGVVKEMFFGLEAELKVRGYDETLEDAAPGEPVRLRNIQTQREIRGIVVNEHIVKIKL